MSGPQDDPLFAGLRALKAEYLAGSAGRMAELWSALERVQNGEPGAAGALRTLVHHLAGSGGAYGFPIITERARAAEQLLDRLGAARAEPAELGEIRAHLQAIADAFDQARATE